MRDKKKTRFGIELTSKCNYECRHCFNNSGPNGRSFEEEEVGEIINHLLNSS